MNYLLDTNVISETIKNHANTSVLNWLNSIPSHELYISTLTFGEIRRGIERLGTSPKKEKLRLWLEHELCTWFNGNILSIDQEISDRWGRLTAHNKTLPAIDSLLAATALHHDMALVTRNTKDFSIAGLELINPWDYLA